MLFGSMADVSTPIRGGSSILSRTDGHAQDGTQYKAASEGALEPPTEVEGERLCLPQPGGVGAPV
jgi:hypothetical protein